MKKKEVKVFGNIYSAEGVKADPEKIAAITAFESTRNQNQTEEFPGHGKLFTAVPT